MAYNLPVTLIILDIRSVLVQLDPNATATSLGVRTVSSFPKRIEILASEDKPPFVPEMGGRHSWTGKGLRACSTVLSVKLSSSPLTSHTIRRELGFTGVRSRNDRSGGMTNGPSPPLPSRIMPWGPVTARNNVSILWAIHS